jgi:phospholipid/cholesterol/gamma-HCH transport system substrate-binding protein
MNYKFKYTGRIVGFFVFISVLILIFTFLSIAVNRKIFVKKFTFKTIFVDAVGLSEKTPITFKGFEIGELKSFNLNNQNLIDAEFIVYEPYRMKIVKNSVLRKTTNPISGKSSIELIQGPDLKRLNEQLALVPEINTSVGKLYIAKSNIQISGDMVSSIVSNINQFLYNLNQDNNQDQGSIFRTLYHVANTSEDLEKTLVLVNETISKFNRDYRENDGELFKTLNQVSQMAIKLNETTDLMNQTINSTNTLIKNYSNPEGLAVKLIDPQEKNIIKPIKMILDNLNQNMIEMQKLLQYFESQSPEVSALLQESKTAISSAQKTLQGINNNPLLRGGIPKDKPTESPNANQRPNELPDLKDEEAQTTAP